MSFNRRSENRPLIGVVGKIATYGGATLAGIDMTGKVAATWLGPIGWSLSLLGGVTLFITDSIPETGKYCCYDITVSWVCENPYYERGASLPSSFSYSVSYPAAWDIWRGHWTYEP